MKEEFRYLLVNMRTGLMDGFYTTQDSAQEVLDWFNSECKHNKEWLLTLVPKEQGDKFGIPNNLFHRTAGSVANERLIKGQ